jgi:hypothetical protein
VAFGRATLIVSRQLEHLIKPVGIDDGIRYAIRGSISGHGTAEINPLGEAVIM